MAVRVLNTNEARRHWRDVVDLTHEGKGDVVIERYHKPLVVVIPFEDYEAIQEELDDLRAGRLAMAELEEWRRDPSTATPYEEFRAELVAEGLLSE